MVNDEDAEKIPKGGFTNLSPSRKFKWKMDRKEFQEDF